MGKTVPWKLNNEEKTMVVKLYMCSLRSITEIGARYGISAAAVTKLARRRGIYKRPTLEERWKLAVEKSFSDPMSDSGK